MKYPTSHDGMPLGMKLPLRVDLESDVGVLAVKDVDDVTIFRTLNGADAHYLVECANAGAEVRLAKCNELKDMRMWVRGYLASYSIRSFGATCEDIIAELSARIERFRR